MIKAGVKTYLSINHSGTLMISGEWGSGKSYFVKHELLPYISTIEWSAKEDESSSFTGEILKIVHNSSFDKAKFFPVMVSVFGKNKTSEIEASIIEYWLNKNTNGTVEKLEKISDGIGKLWNRSEKLKSWFDMSEVLDFKPKIKINELPRNTVIILDDLERVSEDIQDVDLMGFINNLSENLGFKVILIANEEYFDDQHKKQQEFKEKVIEKTLKFNVDVVNVSRSIIEGYGDDEFSSFMSGEHITNSLNLDSEFAKRNQSYLRDLSNLRTLKFAISHFYSVFNELVKYHREIIQKDVIENELLEFCWFTILALSLELKKNNISCINLRGLDKFFYLDSMSINLDLGDDLSDENNSSETQRFENNDIEYCKWFYEFYFRSRGLGIHPIASPELIHYILKGQSVNIQNFHQEYIRDKQALSPATSPADNVLEKFRTEFLSMSNPDVAKNIKELYQVCLTGDFCELSSFINAGIYLYCFITLLPDKTEEDIMTVLKTGVAHWFEKYQLNDYSKSRFEMLSGMIDPKMMWLYDYIKQIVQRQEAHEHEQKLQELLSLFSTDTRMFCAEICPQAFSQMNSYGITHFMNHPILNLLSVESLTAKIKEMSISDASALSELAKHRYDIDTNKSILESERIFWVRLENGIKEYNGDNTAGIIMARKMLSPLCAKFCKK
ncbi:P-loop NTPase fold protein [Bacteroides acidifaciens]|uniref:P-loop NTPase fold protein n=1 Tax=Bacteroides acidifaciens TaxID=85831 RepID=UPI0026248045|nr:P-loop NTPase fold protein [Bacteroides acidifaciens]